MTTRAPSLLLASLLAAPAVLVSGCGGAASTSSPAVATQTATLAVSGMTCASCSVTVKTAVKQLEGIASVQVDVEAGEATVDFDADQVTAEQIAEKITATGYEASVRSTAGA